MRLNAEDIPTDGNLIVKFQGNDALIETTDAGDWQETLDILNRDNSFGDNPGPHRSRPQPAEGPLPRAAEALRIMNHGLGRTFDP